MTPKDVARFMKSQLEEKKYLYQEEIVYEIMEKCGSEFVYTNENGNPAIDKVVLVEFRRITPNVVWERGERCWRLREGYDTPGSRMQE